MKTAPWDLERNDFLDEDEVGQLLQHLRQGSAPERRFDRVIIETLLFSGIRCSEFCRLRLGDVVCASPHPQLEIVGARKAGRSVALPARVGRLLARFVASQRTSMLPDDVDPNDPEQPFFFHERRRPFERTGLYRRVVRILGEVGFAERASVQFLRHTYGYLAYLQTGGNLLFVQRQLGHAHPMITSIYAKFVAEDDTQLANQVMDL